MMVLSTKSPICIRNAIFTNVPPRNGAISEPLWYSVKSMRLDSGGLMSIVLSSIVERDVDAEPIIWFMASEIALKCSSPSSPSVLVPSPPIIRSVIIFTSWSLSTKMLVPSSPLVYLI